MSKDITISNNMTVDLLKNVETMQSLFLKYCMMKLPC